MDVEYTAQFNTDYAVAITSLTQACLKATYGKGKGYFIFAVAPDFYFPGADTMHLTSNTL
jgi:hypothetical protein